MGKSTKKKNKKITAPKANIQELSISRDGGQIALRGYSYQFLYSCYLILSSSNPSNFFQLEGIEDIDCIMQKNGSNDITHIQLKYSVNKQDASFLTDVLKNFLEAYLLDQNRFFKLVYDFPVAKGHLSKIFASKMDEILNASDNDYCDKDSIPVRSDLTFKNGYYVNVTAIFIDIVGSSNMTDEHKRPTLAKMYRAFLSECVAIMNAEIDCKEININGDCVWGVFDTPYKSDIDNVISVAAKLNSMIKILDYKLRKKNYSEISVGIGIDYGRALMVKAGYSGSGINDVIWMGDVVNSACHLCNKAGRDYRKVIVISDVVYNNLNEHNQGLFSSYSDGWVTRYEGDIINISMNDWYNENCK